MRTVDEAPKSWRPRRTSVGNCWSWTEVAAAAVGQQSRLRQPLLWCEPEESPSLLLRLMLMMNEMQWCFLCLWVAAALFDCYSFAGRWQSLFRHCLSRRNRSRLRRCRSRNLLLTCCLRQRLHADTLILVRIHVRGTCVEEVACSLVVVALPVDDCGCCCTFSVVDDKDGFFWLIVFVSTAVVFFSVVPVR